MCHIQTTDSAKDIMCPKCLKYLPDNTSDKWDFSDLEEHDIN